MICPFCDNDGSKVVDSRDTVDGIRRRRECLKCNLRFTTYERIQTRTLMIVKQDGRREEYTKDKLWVSLMKACAKRPLATGTIEKVLEDIGARLSNVGRSEIPSKVIGEMVMEKLKDLDRVAYIRFASVYRDFRDIESFREEIDSLLEPTTNSEVPSNQLSFLEEKKPMPPPQRRRGRKLKLTVEKST